jgi:thiosulfate/3-mercaptopyruvate sulfurtransferase
LVTFTTLIEVASLQAILGDPGVVLLDCRFDLLNPEAGLQAYRAGHIPGARFADLNKDLSAPVSTDSGRHPLPDPTVLAATLERLGIGDHTQVIAYDEANGSIAARAWWLLRWLGHGSIAVLNGGLKAWIAAGGALESGGDNGVGRESPSPVRFTPRVDATAVVDAEQVASSLTDPRQVLVDARLPERFAGMVEPIDPVAGHIAGAVNHPFTRNLAADGRFLEARELRRLWDERLAGRSPDQVVAMCGSGVTACHNLLSLELAGLSGARLYAGSWSEWIKDPTRARNVSRS